MDAAETHRRDCVVSCPEPPACPGQLRAEQPCTADVRVSPWGLWVRLKHWGAPRRVDAAALSLKQRLAALGREYCSQRLPWAGGGEGGCCWPPRSHCRLGPVGPTLERIETSDLVSYFPVFWGLEGFYSDIRLFLGN